MKTPEQSLASQISVTIITGSLGSGQILAKTASCSTAAGTER